MTDEIYVFWDYDQFPYLLGSKLIKIVELGYVITEKYPGMSFKPKFFLNENQGKELVELLEKLDNRKWIEKRKLDKLFEEELNILLQRFNQEKI